MGYRAALTYDKPLGGLAALSCYRISAEEPHSLATEANKHLPIWVAHGTMDQVVTYELGQEAYQSLLDQGLNAEWHEYPMGHEVCMPQIQRLSAWLQQRIGAKG